VAGLAAESLAAGHKALATGRKDRLPQDLTAGGEEASGAAAAVVSVPRETFVVEGQKDPAAELGEEAPSGPRRSSRSRTGSPAPVPGASALPAGGRTSARRQQ
jgi:hypothetical protein